jgi:type 1 fimbriae regulatory protein FimB/type 1 fimbriae regulatory protein FimE
MKASGRNRYGHRDATMILLAFRHGLRACELCTLRWEQVDLAHARLHVSRLKSGIPSVHPLTGTELRALRRLQREQEPGRYLFLSERGAPMSAVGFRRMITRLGKAAKMPFSVHPHMLRHVCGFKLANDGHDTRALQHYLGHKNIQHTVRYTELSPARFRDRRGEACRRDTGGRRSMRHRAALIYRHIRIKLAATSIDAPAFLATLIGPSV